MNIIKRTLASTATLCAMLLLAGCQAEGMTPSQSPLDFGKVLVGSTSPTTTVYWTNNTQETYSIFLWQMAESPFSSTVPAGGDFDPGESTGAATATFTPSAIGQARSKVQPRTAPHGSEQARLRGEGVWLIVEGVGIGVTGASATSPIDFGRKRINTPPPKTATFTITNTNTAAINLAATVVGGAPVFGAQNANVAVPAANTTTTPPTPGSVTVTLTFAPTAVGEQSGAVVFVGPNHKIGVSLKGVGVGAGEEEQ